MFLAICQGIGLAIAAGALAGSLAYEGPNRVALIILAAAAGGALFAASLASESDAAWVGIAFGVPLAFLATNLTNSVVAGARARAEADPTSVSLMVAGAALVLALISILGPVAVLAPIIGGGLLWLGIARRRRETRKHEGLRVLR